MKKSYYISETGEIMNNVILGKPYIFICCGSYLKIKKKKVRKLLSNNISYKVDLKEEELAEIHCNPSIFLRKEGPSIANISSSLSIEKFLELIV